MEAKPFLKEIVLSTEKIADRGVYPFSIPALRNFGSLKFHPDVTFIVGENGSGKSTLIEAIALIQGFGFDGGTKGVQYDPREKASDLHFHLKAIKSFSKPNNYYFLRAETFYKVASYLAEIDPDREYGDYLHEFSHGVAFMKTLDRLGNKGSIYSMSRKLHYHQAGNLLHWRRLTSWHKIKIASSLLLRILPSCSRTPAQRSSDSMKARSRRFNMKRPSIIWLQRVFWEVLMSPHHGWTKSLPKGYC